MSEKLNKAIKQIFDLQMENKHLRESVKTMDELCGQIVRLEAENKSFVEDAHHFSDKFAKAYNENKQLQAELDSLKAENVELRKRLPLGGGPHEDLGDCPTFYDGCHCIVETLVHNIERCEKLQAELDSLKAAKGMTDMGFSPELGKLTYFEEFVKKHPQCYLDEGIKAEIEELQAELEKYRWIPVAERLPETDRAVLVTNGAWFRKAFWIERKSWIFDYVGEPQPITHWRPIILPGQKEAD